MTEDVDFLPRGTLAYDSARLALAGRLLWHELSKPLVRIVGWLNDRLTARV